MTKCFSCSWRCVPLILCVLVCGDVGALLCFLVAFPNVMMVPWLFGSCCICGAAILSVLMMCLAIAVMLALCKWISASKDLSIERMRLFAEVKRHRIEYKEKAKQKLDVYADIVKTYCDYKGIREKVFDCEGDER